MKTDCKKYYITDNVDRKCTHYGGDMCTLGFCEPDILEDDNKQLHDNKNNVTISEDKCTLCGYHRLLCSCFLDFEEDRMGKCIVCGDKRYKCTCFCPDIDGDLSAMLT